MTTFPFLKIARDYGRSYGSVIRMAQDVEWRLRLGGSYARAIEWNATLDGPGPELLRAVIAAIEDEDARRRRIAGITTIDYSNHHKT